jgi:hypothetical protein
MKRLLAAAGAAVLLGFGSIVAVSSPAAASRAECEHGANGFVDIPDTLTGAQPVPGVDLYGGPPGGVRVELHQAVIGGVRRGWAKINGYSTSPGDQVWMDWTWDGWAHWIQCGPFTVTTTGQTLTSAAQRTNPSTQWQFRACGRLSWWTWSECTAPW